MPKLRVFFFGYGLWSMKLNALEWKKEEKKKRKEKKKEDLIKV